MVPDGQHAGLLYRPLDRQRCLPLPENDNARLSENIGSERVMQKSGLIKEAEHIDYEWHDDRMKTRLEYRLLRREWESMQK